MISSGLRGLLAAAWGVLSEEKNILSLFNFLPPSLRYMHTEFERLCTLYHKIVIEKLSPMRERRRVSWRTIFFEKHCFREAEKQRCCINFDYYRWQRSKTIESGSVRWRPLEEVILARPDCPATPQQSAERNVTTEPGWEAGRWQIDHSQTENTVIEAEWRRETEAERKRGKAEK